MYDLLIEFEQYIMCAHIHTYMYVPTFCTSTGTPQILHILHYYSVLIIAECYMYRCTQVHVDFSPPSTINY